MNREFSSFEEDEEIFEIASEFDDPVVRRYAAVLRDAHVTLKSFERPSIAEELSKAGIPDIPAADISEAFRKHLTRGSVGVFWDLENIGLPPNITPMEALTALRDVIMRKFGDIKEFKAYVDLAVFAQDFSPDTRVMFRDCGIEMVDAPHNRRKEVADKHIIVDALWFAVHEKNPIVCIISGDSDFSPLLSKLKMNGVPTIVVSTSRHVRSLREQSRWALSWPDDFIAGAQPPRDQAQRNRAGGLPSYTAYQGQQGGGGGYQGPGQGGNTFYQQGSTRSNISPRRTSPSSVAARNVAAVMAAVDAANPVTRLSPSQVAKVNSPPKIEGGTPGPQIPSTPPNRSFTEAMARSGAADASKPANEVEGVSCTSPESCTQFTDLADCIRQVQKDVGMKKARRSAVGILFKRINPVVPFKKIVVDAEAAGLVKLGGQLGHAWITLSSDHVDEDQQGRPDESARSPSTAVQSAGGATDWWITLRYNQSFPCYSVVQTFRPSLADNVSVTRIAEPQGRWHRMGVGPFRTLMEADNYYTLNFGELQLLPKITQNLKKYVDPSLAVPEVGGVQS
jgi:hypothetical protein